VGKPEGRRPLGRPRWRWLDDIRMDLVEVGWDDVDWIDLAQDRDSTNYPSFNDGYHSPHSDIWNTIVNLFLKHPVETEG
jgi:hypothetical protein